MMSPADFPDECRGLLARLHAGANVSEPALYPGSLAQTDYSVIFASNAGDLLRGGAGMTDFAVPGALYMIRHGLELWLKCILANHRLDQLLRLVVREPDLTFEDLPKHEHIRDWFSKQNVAAFRRGLCVMRNVLVDRLVRPDCWSKRTSDRYANQALKFLRDNPSTRRERIGDLYVPLIDGHNFLSLWNVAKPYVHDLRRGARQHAEEVGGGPPPEEDRLVELVTFLHHLDPDGDALRYPFSLRGDWHAHELRLSLDAVGDLARELTESTRCFRDYRSEVYVHGTVADPAGPLYFGYHD